MRLLLLLLLIVPAALSGRDGGRFRHLTTEDGLSQNSVYCVEQDAKGFMWIGTQDGLSRYDGYRFITYRPEPGDSLSLSGNVVRCLLSDRQGHLWVGTRTGLCRYDPATDKFLRFISGDPENGPASDAIMALAEDAKGKIWIGTLDKGLSVYDPATEKFSHYRHNGKDPGSLGGDDVRGLAADAKGGVWAVTWSHGVSGFDPATGKFTTLTHESGELNHPNSRGAICFDRKGRTWIGTWGRGIDIWDPATKTMTYASVSNNPEDLGGMIWSLMCDSRGRIWAATAETGLQLFDPETGARARFLNSPDNPHSINDNNAWCIAEDRSGQIWTGTWQGGVNILNERLDRFTWLHADAHDTNALPANTVWSFCSDGAGGLWIGTGAGPVHYNRETATFTRPPLYPAVKTGPTERTNVQALCRQPDGTVWMGTTGGGLFAYDPVRKTYREYIPGPDSTTIANSIISALLCDRQGNLWIACSSELQRYDPANDRFASYAFDPSDSLPKHDQVYALCEKDDRSIWIGTAAGKLYLFDKPTRNFTQQWSGTTAISCLSRDQFGGLWIGTTGTGLFYFKDGKATAFTEKSGLPNNVINGIVPGEKDEIWISTNRGICMLNPLTHEARSYNTQDGLQGNEFNQNAYYRAGDGQFFFGGVNGLSAFYPRDITPNLSPADAVITSFTVMNRPYPLPGYITHVKDITLTWRDYFFSFDFAGLEFSNPTRNSYMYMMEGFDETWVEAGDRRFVTYTNLDPGEYTFRVKASNNDGTWNGKIAEVKVVITPPFWRTTWFYTLCGVTLVLAAWGFIRRRERQLRKEKEVLETKVAERTFELQQEKEKVTAAHKDIRDSINYAKRIQYALLAHDELLQANLQEHFILFKPKDIVSGDFYWATLRSFDKLRTQGVAQGNRFYLAVCDSTGHGVPGAFMSLLNISFLNEAVIEKKMEQPGEVFDHVRRRLIENISQEGGQDGMDAILVCFDRTAGTITYAAAHNAPLVVRGKEFFQPGTDKMPVGKGEKHDNFRTRTIDVQPGDMLYLYTDGFADQFGGPAGKKFKETNLRELLASIAQLPAEEQKLRLEETFENWRGELEQIDDTLVIGVRV